MALATIRTREAGLLVEQVQYPHVSRSDTDRARREKKKKTSEVMQRHNDRSSTKKMELMLAANYKPGDIIGTMTYDDAHLPQDRKEAELRFRYFRQKAKKAYAKKGVDPVIFWSTEHVHGEGRWHHHFIITGTGDDYDILRAAWIYGDIEDYKPLRVDAEKNYTTLANYYTKERREKLGLRAWSYTRNARKPMETTEVVDAGTKLEAPKGVTVIESYTIENELGCWTYLKYLLPTARKRRVRARRRRRRV